MGSVSIDITYGKALFKAAEDMGKTDAISEDLKTLKEVIAKNPVFFDLLKSPAISNDDKKSVIQKSFEGSIEEILLNFICILIDKRRIFRLNGMAKEFERCVEEKKGITGGILYSVVKVPESKIREFEEKTGALLRKNVELKNEIDPSLVGGVKVYVDGKLIDASIKRKLDDLKEHLL